MLRESGRVVAVEVDAVWVETIRSTLCGRCAVKAGCGHGVLARATGGKGLVRAVESINLSARDCAIDDEVVIELPESAILRGSLLVYCLPLFFALVGAVLGEALGELAAIGFFVSGLIVGFGVVRFLPAMMGLRETFEPRLASLRIPITDVLASH